MNAKHKKIVKITNVSSWNKEKQSCRVR